MCDKSMMSQKNDYNGTNDNQCNLDVDIRPLCKTIFGLSFASRSRARTNGVCVEIFDLAEQISGVSGFEFISGVSGLGLGLATTSSVRKRSQRHELPAKCLRHST